MKLAYFWLTEAGESLANRLKAHFGGTVESKERFSETFAADFGLYDGIVCIMATGIVVRKLAPLLQSKASDPAVVVLDQEGKFVISLLSGHLGGGNFLATEIAAYLGATPVITTATDVENLPAIDVIAKKNGLVIENLSAVKKISSALLAGEQAELCCTTPVEKETIPSEFQLTETPTGQPCVIISEQNKRQNASETTLYLRPKNLVVGVGCKRGISPEQLRACLEELLKAQDLSIHSVGKIATIGLKQKEPAILALCDALSVPLEIVSEEEIQSCRYPFATSAFVKEITGVSSVAEACAYLAAKQGELLTGKVVYPGITLSICREKIQPLILS